MEVGLYSAIDAGEGARITAPNVSADFRCIRNWVKNNGRSRENHRVGRYKLSLPTQYNTIEEADGLLAQSRRAVISMRYYQRARVEMGGGRAFNSTRR